MQLPLERSTGPVRVEDRGQCRADGALLTQAPADKGELSAHGSQLELMPVESACSSRTIRFISFFSMTEAFTLISRSFET